MLACFVYSLFKASIQTRIGQSVRVEDCWDWAEVDELNESR